MLQPMPPAEPSADRSSSDYSPCPSEPGVYPLRTLAVPQPGPAVQPPYTGTGVGSGRAAHTASIPALASEEPPVEPDDETQRLEPGERQKEDQVRVVWGCEVGEEKRRGISSSGLGRSARWNDRWLGLFLHTPPGKREVDDGFFQAGGAVALDPAGDKLLQCHLPDDVLSGAHPRLEPAPRRIQE
ncbi:hypothetical protein NQZ68_019391, partial [Dissostichus eleginoides]